MKKNIIIFIFILFVSTQTYSQIAFYSIYREDTKLNTLPRFSLDVGIPLNIAGPWSVIKSQGTFLETGFFITNNGLTYDDDRLRYVHNVTGVNVPIRGGVIVNDIYYIGTGFNFNFNVYYKQKTFSAGGRQNKHIITSQFFSKKVNMFYPSMELSAGISLYGLGRFSIRVQYFPISLLNQTWTEVVSGSQVNPFEDLVTMPNMKIVLSYNPGL